MWFWFEVFGDEGVPSLFFLYLISLFLFLYAYNLCLLVSTVVCVLFDTACV